MNCAMRYDAATKSHVPLLTRAGSPVGKRVFEPAPLKSGQRVTTKAVSAFEGYYNAQAKNYLELFATDLNDPVYRAFAPEAVAEIAIARHAWHDLHVFTSMIDSERDPRNHAAVSSLDPAFSSGPPANASMYGEETHDAVVQRLFGACRYLAERPELMTDLAYLTSYNIMTLVSGLGSSIINDTMDKIFYSGGIRGFRLLSGLASAGKTLADLGPGASGLLYVFSQNQVPRTIQTENNPFILDVYRKSTGVLGRSDNYRIIDIDFTKPELLDSADHPPCDHVQGSGITHHFGPDELAGLSHFIARILKPGGTFSIMDYADEIAMAYLLVGKLRDTGLASDLLRDSLHMQNTPGGPKMLFTIEGRKLS